MFSANDSPAPLLIKYYIPIILYSSNIINIIRAVFYFEKLKKKVLDEQTLEIKYRLRMIGNIESDFFHVCLFKLYIYFGWGHRPPRYTREVSDRITGEHKINL